MSTQNKKRAREASDVKQEIRGSEILEVYTVRPDNCPIINVESESESDSLLSQFIYPVERKDFLNRIYRKKALAVLGGKATRFQRILESGMSNGDLPSLLAQTPSEQIFVWMKSTEGTRLNSFEVDENAAVACHQAGGSLYFRAPPEFAQLLLQHLYKDIGIGFAGVKSTGEDNGEVETFFSRKGHLTDFHFDYMENFTFQLRGKKKWSLAKGPIPHPIRGATPHYSNIDNIDQQLKVHRLHDPSFSLNEMSNQTCPPQDIVELSAGDCLYHPAGIWHKVECTEDSLSINISLMPSSWGDLVMDGLRHLLLKEPRWREHIRFDSWESGQQQLAELLSSLPQIVNQLSPLDLMPKCLSKNLEVIFIPSKNILSESETSHSNVSKPMSLPLRKKQKLDVKTSTIDSSLHMESQLILNQLAVLSRISRETRAEAEAKLNHDSDDDDVDAEEEGEEDLDEEKLSSSEEYVIKYMLHINFGNEDLQSTVQFEIIVDERFAPLVDSIISLGEGETSKLRLRKSHSIKSLTPQAILQHAINTNGFSQMNDQDIFTCILPLLKQGYLHQIH